MLNPEIWAENRENSISRYRKYSQESINLFEIKIFFFFGNVRQFISNSNSFNTKYFYDWPISNSSNTPISNYFLTVGTIEEFTVYFGWNRNLWTCRWIFYLNKHFLTIYMDDQNFFRYGYVRFDTNINPQVPVFDINREPVLTPTTHCFLISLGCFSSQLF